VHVELDNHFVDLDIPMQFTMFGPLPTSFLVLGFHKGFLVLDRILMRNKHCDFDFLGAGALLFSSLISFTFLQSVDSL
jgi:hypothetical protein